MRYTHDRRMKIVKYTSIVVTSLVIGAIVGGLFVARYTSRVSNTEMVSWDVDRMVHLSWLAEGKTDQVIDVNMKVLEESKASSVNLLLGRA